MCRPVATILVLTLVGCAHEDKEASGIGPCPDSMLMSLEIPAPRSSAVDVLVVMDESLSMAEEQAGLVSAFPALIGAVLDVPVTDLHIGVVSTDMGTGGYSVETCPDPVDGKDGILQHEPLPGASGCEDSYPPFLSSGELDTAGIGDLGTDFACIATLGTDGCGWEQQLKASRRALVDHADGANEGFLRAGSILVVLFVSDEEDCSIAPGGERIFDTLDTTLGILCRRCFDHPELIEPVGTYVEAFRSLRGDPGLLVVSFIVGVPPGTECEGMGTDLAGCLEREDMVNRPDPVTHHGAVPACSSSMGDAQPGRRYVEVAQALGTSGHVSSVCREDYTPAMLEIADMIGEREEGAPAADVPLVLPVERVPDEPDRCLASCTMVEVLPDSRPCGDLGLACHDPGGTGCVVETDAGGTPHSLCDVPQVAMLLADAGEDCDDPQASRSPLEGAGWIYEPGKAGIEYVGGLPSVPGSIARLSCCF